MAYETTNATGVGTVTEVVVGLFDKVSSAHQAVAELRANGFSANQIGAAFRDEASGSVVNREKENWWEKVKDVFRPEEEKGTSEARLNADPRAQTEYEYDFAGGDFEDSLTGTGIAPGRASYLTRSLRQGGAIVTVRDTDRAIEAERILTANGGEIRYEEAPGIDAADSTGQEVTDTGSVTDTGLVDRRPVGIPASDALPENTRSGAVDRVQLFGEVLRVHKERILRGEARIRKDVVSEEQTVEVPVTREELVLERVPVSGNTPAPGASIGSGQEMRVPLTEETIRLEKQPVVREEVIVGKREVENVTTVGDTVRHEELNVDSDSEVPKRAVAAEELGKLRRKG
jgi:uncharacterized protein (TIGR02271 family)